MSFNLIITVAGIGILVGVLASVLNQSGRSEMAQGVTIMGVIVVLYIVVQSISELFTLVKSVFNLY
ncbi:stage III sporulation protein AC [Candidatus Desulfosporosinus infrequens]|uniref:Stage III sporulation protein AC n=1 Tax=Candidatus Desulfosporosinus infrequens TaxID=2043169 RepID=A0A2U3KC63_9FIRM|nr:MULTISPECIES: stage III sporulation protein AC [unclassified Desulfosporosinus]MDR3586617.1 stage III sporulation protein AC [Desulfosporosinus sp.]SPF37254.1 stage III sporulation protein AC [Candidatus Desulfosporosinus infrequens]EGW36669.1 stage III sporulation protein AC [Desulfosporosinus sp. OT]MDR3601885.1 stage III sporulation protein AC [Desulfosporosinus sp.]ODA41709.1 Stage III sporulation protein AC [Desulfosporosinus sp. BG]